MERVPLGKLAAEHSARLDHNDGMNDMVEMSRYRELWPMKPSSRHDVMVALQIDANPTGAGTGCNDHLGQREQSVSLPVETSPIFLSDEMNSPYFCSESLFRSLSCPSR